LQRVKEDLEAKGLSEGIARLAYGASMQPGKSPVRSTLKKGDGALKGAHIKLEEPKSRQELISKKKSKETATSKSSIDAPETVGNRSSKQSLQDYRL
jgi:hypothetical protein